MSDGLLYGDARPGWLDRDRRLSKAMARCKAWQVTLQQGPGDRACLVPRHAALALRQLRRHYCPGRHCWPWRVTGLSGTLEH